MAEGVAGSNIEVGLTANSRTVPRSSAAPTSSSHSFSEADDDDDLDEHHGKFWDLTIDFTNILPASHSPVISQSMSPLLTPLLANLLRHTGFAYASAHSDERRHSHSLSITLPASRASYLSSPPAHAVRQRRGSADSSVREPSLQDLAKFAETHLRGRKIQLHAVEDSLFASHVSAYMFGWGAEVLQVSLGSEAHENDTVFPLPESKIRPPSTVRLDSGLGSSVAADTPPVLTPHNENISIGPNSSPRPGSEPSLFRSIPPPALSPVDPSINFIVIDDDVATLKRQLLALRTHPLNLPMHSSLLSKRPQLQSRRTRSQAHIRPPLPPASLSIIHFTSLSNYRVIRDLVQGILRTASPMLPLPDVLVIPKPIGPRRLLTAFHTAVKRPTLDPAFAPIATSPASPGGHYFYTGGARASPALSVNPQHNEFDAAAGVALASSDSPPSATSEPLSPSTAPRTPPSGPPSGIGTNPPSPFRHDPADVEYFSRADLGLNASSGIVLHSPDGKPTGLFFQPHKRPSGESRRVSGPSVLGSSPMIRERQASGPEDETEPYADDNLAPLEVDSFTTPISAAVIREASPDIPGMVLPQQIGLGRSYSDSAPSSSTAEYVTPLHAIRLDSLPSVSRPGSDGTVSPGTSEPQTMRFPPTLARLTSAPVISRAGPLVQSPVTAPPSPLSNQNTAKDRDSVPSSPMRPVSPKGDSPIRPFAASPDSSPNLITHVRASSATGERQSASVDASSPRAVNRQERRISNRVERKASKALRVADPKKVPPINVLIVEGKHITTILEI